MSELNPKHPVITVDGDFRRYRRNRNETIPVSDATGGGLSSMKKHASSERHSQADRAAGPTIQPIEGWQILVG